MINRVAAFYICALLALMLSPPATANAAKCSPDNLAAFTYAASLPHLRAGGDPKEVAAAIVDDLQLIARMAKAEDEKLIIGGSPYSASVEAVAAEASTFTKNAELFFYVRKRVECLNEIPIGRVLYRPGGKGVIAEWQAWKLAHLDDDEIEIVNTGGEIQVVSAEPDEAWFKRAFERNATAVREAREAWSN